MRWFDEKNCMKLPRPSIRGNNNTLSFQFGSLSGFNSDFRYLFFSRHKNVLCGITARWIFLQHSTILTPFSAYDANNTTCCLYILAFDGLFKYLIVMVYWWERENILGINIISRLNLIFIIWISTVNSSFSNV